MGAIAGDEPELAAYACYQRGRTLLDSGHPAAACQALSRALALEPHSQMVRETLARAQFDAGHYRAARSSFAALVAANPAADYAHFGLGVAAQRTGELRVAVEHLALAAAMRPDRADYRGALLGARATLSACHRAGGDAAGSPGGPPAGPRHGGDEAGPRWR